METQEYSSHGNLGFETTRRARSQMVWNLSGAVCWRMETFTKWRQAMRTHGLNPVACYVSFETRAFEIYATIAGWSKDVIYQMIRSNS